MAYDPGTGNMVLFGGRDDSVSAGDTWIWVYSATPATAWTQLSPTTSPPARYGASMAYDPGTGNMVLFGGWGGSPDWPGSYLGDTLGFNGTTWTYFSPTTSPKNSSDLGG